MQLLQNLTNPDEKTFIIIQVTRRLRNRVPINLKCLELTYRRAVSDIQNRIGLTWQRIVFDEVEVKTETDLKDKNKKYTRRKDLVLDEVIIFLGLTLPFPTTTGQYEKVKCRQYQRTDGSFYFNCGDGPPNDLNPDFPIPPPFPTRTYGEKIQCRHVQRIDGSLFYDCSRPEPGLTNPNTPVQSPPKIYEEKVKCRKVSGEDGKFQFDCTKPRSAHPILEIDRDLDLEVDPVIHSRIVNKVPCRQYKKIDGGFGFDCSSHVPKGDLIIQNLVIHRQPTTEYSGNTSKALNFGTFFPIRKMSDSVEPPTYGEASERSKETKQQKRQRVDSINQFPFDFDSEEINNLESTKSSINAEVVGQAAKIVNSRQQSEAHNLISQSLKLESTQQKSGQESALGKVTVLTLAIFSIWLFYIISNCL